MKTKKSYNKPSIKVIEIDPKDIIAQSPTLYFDYERENDGEGA